MRIANRCMLVSALLVSLASGGEAAPEVIFEESFDRVEPVKLFRAPSAGAAFYSDMVGWRYAVQKDAGDQCGIVEVDGDRVVARRGPGNGYRSTDLQMLCPLASPIFTDGLRITMEATIQPEVLGDTGKEGDCWSYLIQVFLQEKGKNQRDNRYGVGLDMNGHKSRHLVQAYMGSPNFRFGKPIGQDMLNRPYVVRASFTRQGDTTEIHCVAVDKESGKTVAEGTKTLQKKPVLGPLQEVQIRVTSYAIGWIDDIRITAEKTAPGGGGFKTK